MPLVGGFEGVDITEADPFNMSVVDSSATTANNYAYASIDRALELIKDPESLEFNLACMPGVTNESLTTKLVETCESRADALAIIDLPDVYKPPYQEKCDNFQQRLGTTPAKAAKNLTARALNSSYGATYYPWVKVRDSIYVRDVWVPPSVVALGVMAYTEERNEVWFAPAGFNRGGLNEGNAGLAVLQVTEQLLSKHRDTLYEANINPIASFVTEGLVVFGQKTLQSTQSALDRINVRRLLIFVKKEVSRIANGLLFDQNLPATWNRFRGQVIPMLESVKTRLGLSDFKVILDETTTTPDLIDRNIMYAKIFLKPARAIEFIAVDFVITNTGASFDD
jgi:phage tail sheath protein FI